MTLKTTSPAGIAFIEDHEGFSATPYQDSGGVYTIGFGHTGSVTADTPAITREDAESLLRGDLRNVEKAIYWYVTYPSLNQNQFDSLASFAYNVGTANLKNSTLVKLLNQGDVFGAAAEFDKWVFCEGKKLDGLVNRRAAEKTLFLTPVLVADNGAVDASHT